ncbi:MAG TPA: hypothetical protein VIR58_13775, partial [Acidimicrobiales bacterium]
MAADITALKDLELIDRARSGDRDAFAELYRREAPGAWRLALAVTRSPIHASRAVAAAFATVLGNDGPAPDRAPPLRHQMLRATRELSLAAADLPSVVGSTGMADSALRSD